jgi:hypothetical protein
MGGSDEIDFEAMLEICSGLTVDINVKSLQAGEQNPP